jgi:hypothetical protein
MTWKITRRQIIRPRKELNPQSLHLGRMDLVIESCSEDPLAQGAATAGSQALPEWARHNLRREVSILQREGRRAQLRGDGHKLHGMGVVDWISSRIGLITGRFLDLR